MTSSLRLHSRISDMLSVFLPDLYKRRHENLAWMMTGIQQAQHVHLSKIATHRPGEATLESKTMQLRRFLANDAIEPLTYYEPLARTLIETAARHMKRLRLLVDIVELSGHRQILMVALAYRRRALPLLWYLRRGQGATDAQTQCQLMQAIEPLLPEGKRPMIVADGEFHAVDLLAHLDEVGWGFRFRLPSSTCVHLPDGTIKALSEVEIAPGERRYLQDVYLTTLHAYGPISLAIYWKQGEDTPWFIVTDEDEASYLTLRQYSRRMLIEQLFGDLEGGGFHLDQSQIYDLERLSRLVLVLALVYTWLVHVGSWVIKRGWRNRVDRRDRRDRSLVEIGRYWIRRRLTNEETLKTGLIPYF